MQIEEPKLTGKGIKRKKKQAKRLMVKCPVCGNKYPQGTEHCRECKQRIG